jgi:hypothetical protein
MSGLLLGMVLYYYYYYFIHIPYSTAVNMVLQQYGSPRTNTSYSLFCPNVNVLTIRHVLSITAFCVGMYTMAKVKQFQMFVQFVWNNARFYYY